MKIWNLAIIFVLLTVALTSCSRHSSSGPAQKDLGVVQVFDGKTAQFDLGGGQVCTMTSKVFTNGTILLQMQVERDGKILARPRIQTTSGVPVSIAIGEVNFAMTPVVK